MILVPRSLHETSIGNFHIQLVHFLHLHLSLSLVDRWGATDDLATSSLHSSRLSAFLMAAPSVMPVLSGMLSFHLIFCLPLRLPDVSLLINKTALKQNTTHSLRGFISYANNNCLTELQNTELFTKLIYTWTVITINVLFNGVLI